MKRRLNDLTAEYIRSALSYDLDTGVFRWRVRADRSAYWNRRFSGKVAGVLDPRGYISITVDDRLYVAHRLAWLYVYGEWPEIDIDHVNGLRCDNRVKNLRQALQSQNNANMKITARNKSGFKGVTRTGRRWSAWIKVGGRSRNLGSFETPEDAHFAYVAAATLAYGEFARAA